MSRVDPPVKGAVALSMLRAMPNGDARAYSAVTFPDGPWQGCEQTIRMAGLFGWIAAPEAHGYGVLDVLDANGDIVQDYAVTTAESFQKLKRHLGLVVESTDGDEAPTTRANTDREEGDDGS